MWSSSQGGGEKNSGFWGFANGAISSIKASSESLGKELNEFSQQLTKETSEIQKELAEKKRKREEEEVEEQPEEEVVTGYESEDGLEANNDLDGLGDNIEHGLHGINDALENGLDTLATKLEDISGSIWSSIGGVLADPSLVSNTDTSANAPEKDELEGALRKLQASVNTYTTEPVLSTPEEAEKYKILQRDFNERYEEFWSNEIISLLTNSTVRQLYDKLVPDEVSEELFWCRFVFRQQTLEAREKRRKELATKLEDREKQEDLDELAWDDDDEDNADEVEYEGDEIEVDTSEVKGEHTTTGEGDNSAKLESDERSGVLLQEMEKSHIEDETEENISDTVNDTGDANTNSECEQKDESASPSESPPPHKDDNGSDSTQSSWEVLQDKETEKSEAKTKPHTNNANDDDDDEDEGWDAWE